MSLKRQGWYQRDIAKVLDVTDERVSRWMRRVWESGPEALRGKTRPGRRPRLTMYQKRTLPEFLWHGAEAYGFRGEVWTRARVARVIEEEFGVRCDKSHVGRLLNELRWTPQVPIRRALQRNEAAIRSWREAVWPELLRRSRRERRMLVFEDESGFYLLPGVVRTYAPEADTPVIRELSGRDHLSVMGGMTPGGKIFTLMRQQSLNGLHVIEFLVHLQRVAGKRLLIIWDGSPIHRRTEVTEYISGTQGRVWVEPLPGYAPDLNPWDEGGWHHLKNVEMRNLVCLDLEQLHEEFYLAVGRLRQKPQLILSFFSQAGLTIPET